MVAEKKPSAIARLFGAGSKSDKNPPVDETAAPARPANAEIARPAGPAGDVMRKNREALESLLKNSREDVVRMAMGQASGEPVPAAPDVDPDEWKKAGPGAWRYNGEWENGTMHGQGKLVYADGWTYVGGWKSGTMDGQGSLTQADGTLYEGTWRNGRMNGLGKLTYPDGWSFIGNWKDGQISGQGTLIHPGK
jgi:hypothetical protein